MHLQTPFFGVIALQETREVPPTAVSRHGCVGVGARLGVSRCGCVGVSRRVCVGVVTGV